MVPAFGALAEISKAMQPNPEVLNAVADNIDDDDFDDFMYEMSRFASTIGPALGDVMRQFGPMISDVLAQVEILLTNPELDTVSPER